MSMSMTNTENRTPIRVGFYDIEKTIGKGNFAVVKLARHRLTKNEVAIKIIDKTQLQAPDLRRAYREVRVLKKLYHPHIIRLYQVMETKNMLYIVTEYAPKGEIFEHIASNGRLPEPFARRIYWQVVSAVDYCHKRGVVHRDLKAENLLFDAEGSVKLADFGFSTWWSQDAMLSTWCGSPPYAAPEVFEGRQYMGPEIDIWSLGVVLYVLVCGALPFDASTLPALRDRVLSARFRVPYFMSAECEALVRRMLMRDPTRRYNIDQVKQHGWMQADKPPRLLPAPGQPPPANVHKQYLDPGLAPDVLEPNEQILRLMASLGIDSSRTKESLQQQSYDHHAAIYFLLLERLRQHPGGKLSGGSIASRPTPGAVRMLSTDSSTCRKMPRRPSTVAEAAMRKMNPGPSTAPDAPPGPMKAQYPPGTAAVQGSSTQDHTFWKTHRPVHAKVGQSSHTSSVDEGVADMDSSWDQQDFGGSVGTIDRGSSASSGFVQSNASASASIASRSDWKWPAPGCSSYSNQTSTADSPRASGSPGESVHGSSTTLSSWDSSWGATGLAGSMPSCPPTQSTSVDSNNSRSTRRLSSIDTETPRSPDACLTTGRLWIPEVNPPAAIPTEFTLGRRASDGLIGGRRIGHFTNRLTGARAGGIATLTETDDNSAESVSGRPRSSIHSEDSLPPPDSQFFILCSPAKRPSLPDARKGSMLPSNYGLAPVREPGPSQQPQPPSQQQWTSPGTSHLHKQLMSLRLQRRTGVNEPPGEMIHSNEPTEHGRKAVLRQQSYKLAQQQPVLSPLHSQSNYPCFPIDLDSCIFRPIGSDEGSDRTRLHCHEEEQEEDEEEEHCSGMGASGGIGSHGSVGGMTGNLQLSDLSRTASPWSMSMGNPRDSSNSWQNLPVTMGDCRLTDSNSSLSRLSPLLQYSDISSSNYNHPSHPHHSTPPPPLAYDPPPSLSYDWNPANSAPAQTFLPNSQQSMSSMMMNPEHDTTKDN